MDALQDYSSSSSGTSSADDTKANSDTDTDTASDSSSSSSTTDRDDRATSSSRKRKRGRGETSNSFVRSFAHVRGNWPTYICVRVEASDAICQHLQVLSEAAQTAVAGTTATKVPIVSSVEYPTAQSGLEESLEQRIAAAASGSSVKRRGLLHLSLSRTVTLQHKQIEPFARDVIQALAQVPSFHAVLQGCELFSNDEKTRSFVSLPVTNGRDKVCNIIRVLDGVLTSYGKPAYYDNPRPHVTVASQKGHSLFGKDVAKHMKKGKWETYQHYINVSKISIVIGNKLFTAHLNTPS